MKLTRFLPLMALVALLSFSDSRKALLYFTLINGKVGKRKCVDWRVNEGAPWPVRHHVAHLVRYRKRGPRGRAQRPRTGTPRSRGSSSGSGGVRAKPLEVRFNLVSGLHDQVLVLAGF